MRGWRASNDARCTTAASSSRSSGQQCFSCSTEAVACAVRSVLWLTLLRRPALCAACCSWAAAPGAKVALLVELLAKEAGSSPWSTAVGPRRVDVRMQLMTAVFSHAWVQALNPDSPADASADIVRHRRFVRMGQAHYDWCAAAPRQTPQHVHGCAQPCSCRLACNARGCNAPPHPATLLTAACLARLLLPRSAGAAFELNTADRLAAAQLAHGTAFANVPPEVMKRLDMALEVRKDVVAGHTVRLRCGTGRASGRSQRCCV